MPNCEKWELKPSVTLKSIKHADGTVTTYPLPPPATLNATAVVGDVVTWSHSVKNIGDGGYRESVVGTIVEYQYVHNHKDTPTPESITYGGTHQILGILAQKSTGFDSDYKVEAGDERSTICRTTQVKPHIWDDATTIVWEQSEDWACVKIGGDIKKDWEIVPSTTVDRTTAIPDDMITWTHTIQNIGSSPVDKNVTVKYQYGNNGSAGVGLGGGVAGNYTAPSELKNTDPSPSMPSVYIVKDKDVGLTLCRNTQVKPNVVGSTVWTKSVEKCVTITAEPPPQAVSECRPIVFAVSPRDHSYTYNGVTYSQIIPINRVYTNLKEWLGPFPTPTTLNATEDHTTGDAYTVTFVEKDQHIESKYDTYILVDDYNQPIADSNGTAVGQLEWIPTYVQILVVDQTITIMGEPESWTTEIGPCYDYKLTAKIGNTSTIAIESGGVANIVSSVSMATYPDLTPQDIITKSKPTQWQLNKLIFDSGVAVNSLDSVDSNSGPCDYFMLASSASSCGPSPIASGVDHVFNPDDPSSLTLPPLTLSITDDYRPGTKICFVLSVQPLGALDKTFTDERWNHSSLSKLGNCVIIVKKPKVQIWGGDLLTKGLVQTSTSDKATTRFGSWTEYGIIAKRKIDGAASGSAYAGAGLLISLPISPATACNYSNLSFANVKVGNTSCDGTGIGNYSNVDGHTIPDVAASFTGTGDNVIGSVVPNNLPKNTLGSIVDIYSATGDLTLGASTLEPSRSIVIKATGTVFINGDQMYNPGPFSTISQIPQLVIIANKIIINDDVTNVDAWLIAKGGSIKTCFDEAKDINPTCNQPLIVNGPVMTDKLYLYRTHGSEPGVESGEPAEIFNLRADAYLWAIGRASEDGRIQTVYSTELPPRL